MAVRAILLELHWFPLHARQSPFGPPGVKLSVLFAVGSKRYRLWRKTEASSFPEELLVMGLPSWGIENRVDSEARFKAELLGQAARPKTS